MRHHAFSLRSVLLISSFVIAFTAAVVVDLVALLEVLGSGEGIVADDDGNGGRYYRSKRHPVRCDGHVYFCRRLHRAARSLAIQRALKSAIDS